MHVSIGNCTAITPEFGGCRRIGTYWDQSANFPNCTWGVAEGSFDGFYIYSGVESTNTTFSALQQSFDWVTVRKHFPYGASGSTTTLNPNLKPTRHISHTTTHNLDIPQCRTPT